jgi:FkbM family methyltransferase
MIIQNFRERFLVLKKNGCHIQYVLDIGAYHGDFTDTINSVWPSALVRQIEADDRQKGWLHNNAIIALLGDREQEDIDFYTLPDTKITTGSSIFLEMTPHYSPGERVVMKKNMTTIDQLDSVYNFYGNWREHGLVKLDTQGSELLILTGASNFLRIKEPKYILLECSIQEYNNGAPDFFTVVEFMHKLKYKTVDIFDRAYDSRDKLLQIDILFERAN